MLKRRCARGRGERQAVAGARSRKGLLSFPWPSLAAFCGARFSVKPPGVWAATRVLAVRARELSWEQEQWRALMPKKRHSNSFLSLLFF